MTINDSLFGLYESKWDDLCHLENKIAEVAKKQNRPLGDYSFPLLMCCWDKEYLSSNKKLLFVGQETNKWWSTDKNGKDIESFWDDGALGATVDYYKNFKLGEGYGRPFWNAVYKINGAINPNMKLNFLWTNICKFGRAAQKGRVNQVVSDAEIEFFNVFADELEIAKPDAVIFFTGPNYDADIRKRLPDAEFLPINALNQREFAQVGSKHLPEKSFRTYHPGYLQRGGKTSFLDELIELIK